VCRRETSEEDVEENRAGEGDQSEQDQEAWRRAGEEFVTVETVGDDSVRVESGMAANPDAMIAGSPQQVLALLAGETSLAELQAKGLRYEGDVKLLARFASR